ncbi:ABC transporter ATP-binding protein [Amycolatopsis sp. 195334CR]|uniref:ABC transporter ATP-binding protein n=1 Tax=Amycolatopsis sp. 195334CR TaxID=2814588 RepID=UPI001A8E0A72|nr:ABC transporter ATP-binding protein [Amycolatopsis sp. 195334CR]MBN6038318.1 ABC transporter ATP-binding protein [Amycolatopsis sp. 195334CR]
MENTAVRVDRLCRKFRTGRGKRAKENVALDGLSLSVTTGEVHGLLGPNGAGKTTLCKIVSTVLLPDSGAVTVLGHDVVREAAAVRPRLGIVFGGERGLYGRLTARQNLHYWAALYQLPDDRAARRAGDLLDRLGLGGKADELVETFSRGMKQRLHLARGLIGEPELILFDEPTIGMDPVAAREFRELVGELRADGLTILLTTHDMAEAEAVCQRVTLIDEGRVVATETPRGLATMAAKRRRVEAEDVPEASAAKVRDLPGVLEAVDRDGLLRVRTDGDASARAVLALLLDDGVRTVRAVPPTLEDVYLDLIGPRGMAL